MTKLSPAARAVLESVTWKKYGVPPEGLPAFAEEMAPLLAVALRAAIEQVLYEEKLGWTAYGYCTHFQNQILAIATELEGNQ